MPVTELRKERRRAKLCIICGKPSPQSRCGYHAELARRSAQGRYQRDRARKMTEVAGRVENAPVSVLLPPTGTNPTQCESFKVHAVDNMQRVDCARRKECVTYAIKRNWRAFTCAGCSVREVAPRTPIEPRCSAAAFTLWPNVSGLE